MPEQISEFARWSLRQSLPCLNWKALPEDVAEAVLLERLKEAAGFSAMIGFALAEADESDHLVAQILCRCGAIDGTFQEAEHASESVREQQ